MHVRVRKLKITVYSMADHTRINAFQWRPWFENKALTFDCTVLRSYYTRISDTPINRTLVLYCEKAYIIFAAIIR